MRSKIFEGRLTESCIEMLDRISQFRSSTGFENYFELEGSELLLVGEHLGNVLGPVIEGPCVTQVSNLNRRRERILRRRHNQRIARAEVVPNKPVSDTGFLRYRSIGKGTKTATGHDRDDRAQQRIATLAVTWTR